MVIGKTIYCRVWTKEGYYDLTYREWLNFDDELLHREDGPAEEFTDGDRFWWQNGKQHRVDGPAVMWKVGKTEWWLNNEELDKKIIEKWIKENNINLETIEGQVAFKLQWS